MATGPLAGRLARLFKLEAGEAPAVFAGLGMFFLLFTGYALLRPVRDTMGIAGGVDNLQWLFTATFVATKEVRLAVVGQCWVGAPDGELAVVAWLARTRSAPNQISERFRRHAVACMANQPSRLQ